MNNTVMLNFCSVQGDAAGGDRGQGGAGETAPAAGRGQSCYQGDHIPSDQITWSGYSVFYLALCFPHLELSDFGTLQKKLSRHTSMYFTDE